MTIGQAVKLTGKSKTTLHKLTKSGKLSVAKKNNKGHNLYDSAELIRVFGEPLNELKVTYGEPEKELEINRIVDLLEQQNKELKEQLEKIELKNQKLEEKNDKLIDELLTINKRLLEAPKEKEATKEPPTRKKFLGLF